MAGLQKPVIAITMGDPCGIGPEVISKALAHKEVYDACRPVVIGNSWCMEQAVELTGRTLRVREVESPSAAGLSPEQVDVVDIHNLNLEDVTVGGNISRLRKGGNGVGDPGRRIGNRRAGKLPRYRPNQQRGS